MAGTPGHRRFGHVRKLPSKRWQASYIGPDLERHLAPQTFDAKDDATVWLVAEAKLVDAKKWLSPSARDAAVRAASITVGQYADMWLSQRTLKPRTVAHYRSLIDRFITPTIGTTRVDALTPATVRTWLTGLGTATPTQTSHAYALLKAVMATAVHDDLLVANPCRVRGAGQARRVSRTEPATVPQLDTIVAELPERYRAMALMASWCALRFGELIELRRSDIDLAGKVIHVHRAAVWMKGGIVIGTPKSDAGVRDVAIPPHLLPAIRSHLRAMAVTGRDGLLFPAAHDATKHMRPATLCKVYYPAREAAGRPDLRFHDLRHTGAVMATTAGASLAEVMDRLGHSTPTAAMRYQHAAKGRDAIIAAELSKMATTTTK